MALVVNAATAFAEISSAPAGRKPAIRGVDAVGHDLSTDGEYSRILSHFLH